MKKILATFILALSLALNVGVVSSVAASFDYRDILRDVRDGVENQSTEVEDGAEELVLPVFEGDEFNPDEPGVLGIVSAIDQFLNFLKLIVAPVAVLFMTVMAIRMISAGKESEETYTKFRNYMRYSVEGLVIIFAADIAVEVMFGPEGEVLRGGEAGAREAGRRTTELIEGIYSLVQVMAGSVAVFYLVTAGMRYVAGGFSDDQVNTAKRQITWSLAGLFLIGISEFLVKEILFPGRGTDLGTREAKQLIAQITNFAAGTIGTLAFAFLLYAGYLYVVARDNEDNVAKAKKIIFGAFIGILIAAAAFAFTNTLVELDAAR